MKDYTRNPDTGEIYFKGQWYDPDDLELVEAENAYERDLELQADIAMDQRYYDEEEEG